MSETRADDEAIAFCATCGASPAVLLNNQQSFRESYRCNNCGASARERCLANTLVEIYGKCRCRSLNELVELDDFKKIKVYEPGITGINRRFLSLNSSYLNSFFWPERTLGSEIDGVRNESLESLTLAADSLDLVVTSDIFEHIRHPSKALREIARVLRVGGYHIFSVPITDVSIEKTQSRVDVSSDEDIYLLEPHYHGNGAGGKSLVYNDFGSDFFQIIEAAGFYSWVSRFETTHKLQSRVVSIVSMKKNI